MPTVPAYDLPTQELASTQLNTFQSPNVQPMSDIAGKQISEMGKATLSLGTQFQKLADEVRDANVKAGDTAFLSKVQDILYNKDSGYMWKKNKDAMENAGKVFEDFDKAAQDVRATMTDPLEQQAFDTAVNRHRNSFGQNVNRHAGEQTFNYRKTEAEARATSYADAAIGSYGRPEFNQYLKTAHAEISSIADMAGLGDEARKAAMLKVNTNVYGNVVTNLMLQNKYGEAKTVLDEAVSKGMITTEAQQQLTRTMKTGLASESGRKIADNLGAGKGAIAPDADSAINWVINYEKGYVKDDAGKGETNFGVNISANPNVDVKNLTESGAAQIYKKDYWNKNNIDSLPENMRVIAFDAYVNQGTWAKGAIAQALKTDNPAQTLIDLRKARYAQLIKDNPKEYAKFENEWNRRMKIMQSNLDSYGAVPKTLNEQISNIDAMARNGIIDDQTREYAINRAQSNWKLQIDGQAQFDRGVLDTATKWVQQHPGADISQMDPIMQQNLKNSKHWDTIVQLQANGGKFKQNDAAWGRFLLMSDQQKAELTVDQFTNQYRGKLDDDHYQQGVQMISQLRGEVKKGQNTEIVSNSERIKWAAQQAKIIVAGEKNDATAEENYARFQREVHQRVVQYENTKLGGKRKVDGDELDTIINGVLTDKVKTGGFFGFFAKEQPVSVMDPGKLNNAYVEVGGRTIKLMDIPAKDRETYAGKLRKIGLPVTQQAIAQLWAADHPEK